MEFQVGDKVRLEGTVTRVYNQTSRRRLIEVDGDGVSRDTKGFQLVERPKPPLKEPPVGAALLRLDCAPDPWGLFIRSEVGWMIIYPNEPAAEYTWDRLLNMNGFKEAVRAYWEARENADADDHW